MKSIKLFHRFEIKHNNDQREMPSWIDFTALQSEPQFAVSAFAVVGGPAKTGDQCP